MREGKRAVSAACASPVRSTALRRSGGRSKVAGGAYSA